RGPASGPTRGRRGSRLQPSRERTGARAGGGGGSVPSWAWTGARAGGLSSASSVTSPMTRPAGRRGGRGVDHLDGGAAGAVRVDPAGRGGAGPRWEEGRAAGGGRRPDHARPG
ncbi:Ribose-5-phosphate isomerase A, partial [Frankliniella fusca]